MPKTEFHPRGSMQELKPNDVLDVSPLKRARDVDDDGVDIQVTTLYKYPHNDILKTTSLHT